MRKKNMFTSILAFFVGFVTLAQNDGYVLPPPQVETGPPGLSIDSGVAFVFVLALSYGIYKTYKLSKKSNLIT